VEDPEHVDVQHPLEDRRVDRHHRAVAGDPGVRHHDVDAAEPRHTLGDGLLHGGEVADVGGDGQDVVAELVREHGQRLLVEVGQHEPGPSGVQPSGGLGTDAAGGAGDQDGLAVQGIAHVHLRVGPGLDRSRDDR
jgi:hypothetical protein